MCVVRLSQPIFINRGSSSHISFLETTIQTTAEQTSYAPVIPLKADVQITRRQKSPVTKVYEVKAGRQVFAVASAK